MSAHHGEVTGLMAGEDATSDKNANWSDWLSGLRDSADPLGVWRLMERGSRALDSAQTPAEATRRLAAAIDEERARQQHGITQLDQWLKHWAQGLRSLAPLLPDSDTGDVPPLGPFPRRQALLQDLARQQMAYQAALEAHLESVTTLAEECTAAFREALASESGAPVESLPVMAPETLLERWTSVAEPRYEAWLAEPATQARIAALVNAWSELAATLRTLTDDGLEALGLPSARGMDDLAEELQRQRRRHRQDMAELRREMAELRARLDGDSSP